MKRIFLNFYAQLCCVVKHNPKCGAECIYCTGVRGHHRAGRVCFQIPVWSYVSATKLNLRLGKYYGFGSILIITLCLVIQVTADDFCFKPDHDLSLTLTECSQCLNKTTKKSSQCCCTLWILYCNIEYFGWKYCFIEQQPYNYTF